MTLSAASINANRTFQTTQSNNRGELYGQVTAANGMFLAVGSGESTQHVDFPIIFTEIPILSFGGHLEDNQSIVATQFPTVSVVVVRYDVDTRQYGNFYTGATLATVISGNIDMRMYIHWTFTGHALTNPIAFNDSVDGII